MNSILMCVLVLGFLAFVWAMQPTCGPGEVYVRGAVTLVCVRGHN